MTEIQILSMYENEGSFTEPTTHIMKIKLIEKCVLDVPLELLMEIISREYKEPMQHCRYSAIIKNQNGVIPTYFKFVTIENLKSTIQKAYDEVKNNY